MKKQTTISERALKILILLFILSIGVIIALFSFWRSEKENNELAKSLYETNMLSLTEIVYNDLSVTAGILEDIDSKQSLAYAVNSAGRMLSVVGSDMYSHFRATVDYYEAEYAGRKGKSLPGGVTDLSQSPATDLYELGQELMWAVADGEEETYEDWLYKAEEAISPLLEIYEGIYAGTDYTSGKENIMTDSMRIFSAMAELNKSSPEDGDAD